MIQPPARSLCIQIDPDARTGLQQQVYAGIRRAILDGTASPGTRMPSSRALAMDLGISRTTAVLALDQLVAEGYLTARRAMGTFVVSELPDVAPEQRIVRPRQPPRHPPVSSRGAQLGAARPSVRLGGPPRAFRLGVPALDLFPVRTWAQIATRRLKRVTVAQLDYGEAVGLRELRQAIADHVSTSRGTRCDAEQVFVVAGAQRGIEIVCELLLDPGDRAWLEHPAYPGARKALLSAGARIVPVRVDGEGLDVAAGARRGEDARLVYVTPSHQFPLGVPMSLPRRLALLEWASAARAWIVEDDYDSEFRHGARPIPCLHGLDGEGRVIYVGSFSKSLFPSLRLGFVIVPPDLRETLRAARLAADIHPPTLDQAALAEFIADGHFDRHLRRMRGVYTERLEALIEAVERSCRGALRLRGASTGLHVAADLEGADDMAVYREATSRGVEVMPLSAYSIDDADRPNGLVLGFGSVRPEAARAGAEQLAAAIEAACGAASRETR